MVEYVAGGSQITIPSLRVRIHLGFPCNTASSE